jgi:hypothetical protein
MYDEIGDVRAKMMAKVCKVVDAYDGLRDEQVDGQNLATFLWTHNRFLARDPS